MKRVTGVATLGTGILLCAYGLLGSARSEDAPAQAGVEVQARGPVHEAYAEPAMRRQGAGPVVPKQPPPPVNELPAEERPADANVEWIPGYWAWDDERNDFLWVSGLWRVPPPGRHWVPGYWQQEPGGWTWVSGYWGDQTVSTEDLLPAPPDPIEEAQPPAPNESSFYAPGNWVYQQDQYYWQPGHWVGYQPGWIWTTPTYLYTPGGYIYVNGYWDHDFDHRGILFAPVALDRRLITQPNWFYRPGYAILPDNLLQSFFVRPSWNHYYFGDYYEPRYVNLGIRPWYDFRAGDRFDSPLYRYYRWENRANPRWDSALRESYVGRRDGTVPRPARTLAAQGDKGVRLLTPLHEWKGADRVLERTSNVHVQQARENTVHVRNLEQHRVKNESTSIVQTTPAKLNTAHRIELPKRTVEAPVVRPPIAVKQPVEIKRPVETKRPIESKQPVVVRQPVVRTPPPAPVAPRVAPQVPPRPPAAPRGARSDHK